MILIISVLILIPLLVLAVRDPDSGGGFAAGVAAAVVGVAVVAMAVVAGVNHIIAGGTVAANQARYEALVYQFENNFYDNDNDVGKKQLMSEIQAWNEDLAYHKQLERDLWVGVFHPNIYSEFEFIELGGGD